MHLSRIFAGALVSLFALLHTTAARAQGLCLDGRIVFAVHAYEEAEGYVYPLACVTESRI